MTHVEAPVRVPTSRYTSPGWAAREEELLWPRTWQAACTADHVAHAGDFYEHRLGRLSVLIVRDDDGELRAFQNVCRHRGNALCEGSGDGLTELRCGFHRWTWDLQGQLREVPSRKSFGALRNEDVPLFPVQVGTWGPLVFVNLDLAAEPLADYLEGVPDDIGWVGLDDFRCNYTVEVPVPSNWKTVVDGFSETYHVQGLHREMLPIIDDVDAPQRLWERHGTSMQRYGLPSPRLGNDVDDQAIWESFVKVMGTRVGMPTDADPGVAPPVPPGSTLRSVIAQKVRAHGATTGVDLSRFDDDQTMDLHQYNLFPNMTLLVYPDLLQVLRARPGHTPTMRSSTGSSSNGAPRTTPARASSRSTPPLDPTTPTSAWCSTRTSRSSSARNADCTNPGSRTSHCRVRSAASSTSTATWRTGSEWNPAPVDVSMS